MKFEDFTKIVESMYELRIKAALLRVEKGDYITAREIDTSVNELEIELKKYYEDYMRGANE